MALHFGFVLILGGFVFVALPVAAAWNSTHRRLVASLLLTLAFLILVVSGASTRMAWNTAPESEPERQAYLDGVDRMSSIAGKSYPLLLGPIAGLALLTLVPARSIRSSEGDA